MVTMNQRLDAETIANYYWKTFGFEVEFVGADVQESIKVIEEKDSEEELVERVLLLLPSWDMLIMVKHL